MKKNMKKLMSLLLAVSLLLGSLFMSITAVAESGINLKLNGGTLTSNVEILPGDPLPNYEGITKSGATFGGWFTDSAFTSAQVYTAAANTTYYARWVIHDVDVANFDSYTIETFKVGKGSESNTDFRAYKYPGDIAFDVTLNTSSANAYSGNNSVKLVLDNVGEAGTEKCLDFGDRDGHRWWDDAAKVEDGFCFWISTDKEITFKFATAWTYGNTITVPAGKHIITMPETWGVAYDSKFIFNIVEGGATVYIDDIGTFTDAAKTSTVTFETNKGTLVDTTAAYQDGDALPEYDDIVRDGATFAGWYTTPDFSGDRVYTATEGATYYARWIVHEVTVTDFEGWDDTTFASNTRIYNSYHSNRSASATLNTNSANAYSGSNSAKIYVSWDGDGSGKVIDFGDNDTTGRWYTDANLKDGFSFWMSTDHPVSFQVQLAWAVNTTVTVPAGKHFVTIPKASGYNYNFKLVFLKPDGPRPTVYIDDIGTYSLIKENAIALEKNGGTLVDETPIYGGDTLPTADGITKDGAIFAGWYDNDTCVGERVYTAVEGVTYYAKWLTVVEKVDFEDYDANNIGWENWSSGKTNEDVGSTLSLNTDAAHAYSGSKSLKLNIIKGKDVTKPMAHDDYRWGIIHKGMSFSSNSDGFYFWAENSTPVETDLEVVFNHNTGAQAKVTAKLAPGKQFIIIPWSKFGASFNQTNVGTLTVRVKCIWNYENAVCIDDIGTYQEVKTGISINYNLGGGSWTQGYTAPERVTTGTKLPTYENITNGDFTFGGWYLNAEHTGDRVYTVPSNATDGQNFYAHWINHNVNGTNFDADDDTSFGTNYYFWTGVREGGTTAALNTNRAYASSGNNSAKLNLKVRGSGDTSGDTDFGNALDYGWWAPDEFLGEGVCFWMYTDKDVSFKIQSDGWATSEKTISVAAGKHFVTVPKEIFSNRRKYFHLRFSSPAEAATVYIDDIGTYSTAGSTATITYHLNEGTLTGGPTVIDPFHSTVLPTEDQIKREGWFFAGWYDNPEFTGYPVFYVGAAEFDKDEFWAKWVEDVKINYDFEKIGASDNLADHHWRDADAYDDPATEDPDDGWRPHGGGFKLNLEQNTANLAPDSTKGIHGEYTVQKGGYTRYEQPNAVFRNFNWSTTFSNRGAERDGDGFCFWVKSDKQAEMKIVFMINGDPKYETYTGTFKLPAGVGVRVYLPWSYLNKDDPVIARCGFQIYGAIGTSGNVWIDDLGIYNEEKPVTFVAKNADEDIMVKAYNSHLVKGTSVSIEKKKLKDLTDMGGALPEGAKLAYLANFMFQNENGGAADVYGPTWISFKLPLGADLTKLGAYEVFFDGSTLPVNYIIEGNWVTISNLNTSGDILITLNDTVWQPTGIAIDKNVIQDFKETITTVIPGGTNTDTNTGNDTNTDNNTDNTVDTDNNTGDSNGTTGNKRPPKREPLKDTAGDNADTEASSFPLVIVLVIAVGGVAILGAGVVIIVTAAKRRNGN